MSEEAYVALVRSVNVGGRNRLAMATLRQLVEELGGVEVQTYLQSGNVVFSHRALPPARLAAQLEEAIAREESIGTKVAVRTGPELAAVLAANPFPERPASALHVAFLTEELAPGRLEGAGLESFLPEEAAGGPRELYLYLPNGVGRSRLPSTLERRLQVPATLRNWRTVSALAQMAADLAPG